MSSTDKTTEVVEPISIGYAFLILAIVIVSIIIFIFFGGFIFYLLGISFSAVGSLFMGTKKFLFG